MDERLTTGDLVYVIDGPVPVDGYPWLLVAELSLPSEPTTAGWIAAASREGEQWVVPSDPPCPDEISVEAFAWVADALLLYCFGGQELTLEGALGYCAHGDPVIQEPAWLGNYFCAFEAVGRPRVSHWPAISVHLHPDTDVPSYTGDPRPLRITGRYDAPVAQTCRFAEGAEEAIGQRTDLAEALLVFHCRRSFVVESAERL